MPPHPEEGKSPSSMLTAKGDETDRVVGLEMGADDYLPSPSAPRAPGAASSGAPPGKARPLPENGSAIVTSKSGGGARVRVAGRTID